MKIGAVIVNYNCAPLSLNAALSVLGDNSAARVVIVDNASSDHSIEYLNDVIGGRAQHQCASPVGADPAPRFANLCDVTARFPGDKKTAVDEAQISIIAADKNAGFAAGCNIGIRYMRQSVDPDIYLLLNPDALIGAGALKAFAERLKDESAGLCGASVFRHENPNCAQALGGAHLNRLTLLGENIAAGSTMRDAPTCEQVEASLSYPLGVAMGFRKDYLDIAGYLDERFFLYYEEADWARRGAPQRRTVWARSAVVYHRHGAAAGSRVYPGVRSALSDYHMTRSRILYALKWRPLLLPLLLLVGIVQAMRRITRGHWRQAAAVIWGSLPGAPRRAA